MNAGQLNEVTSRLDKLIERTEPTMKDEMYIALRSYLEEQSAMLRQILDEVKAQRAPDAALKEQAAQAAGSTPPSATKIVNTAQTGPIKATPTKGK